MSTAFWANLTRVGGVYLQEQYVSLPANPLQNPKELSKAGIQHMLREESFSPGNEVEILYKHHSSSIAETMSKFIEEILATVRNMLV
jgi:HEPN domain-containing protein